MVERPNLELSAFSVNNTTPGVGNSITLSVTVNNTGEGEAEASTLTYYRSTDSTIGTQDNSVGMDNVPSLTGGADSPQYVTIMVSDHTTYYYGACVSSVTGESDTGDNCSSGVRVVVARPDLEVSDFSVNNTTPGVGNSITLSVTVSNTEEGEAGASTLTYHRSTDSTIGTQDPSVGMDNVPSLTGGADSSQDVTITRI